MNPTTKPSGTVEDRLTRIELMLADIHTVHAHEIAKAKAERERNDRDEREREAARTKFDNERPARERLLRAFIGERCSRGLNHNATLAGFAAAFKVWLAEQDKTPVVCDVGGDQRVFAEAIEISGCAGNKVVNDYNSPVEGFLGLSVKPQWRNLDCDTRNGADDYRAEVVLRARREGKPVPV